MAPSSASLLARTSITVALSGLAIAGTIAAAGYAFVIEPILEQAADDEAALFVLSAQVWVELEPDVRPAFALELAEEHGLIISTDAFPTVAPSDLDAFQARLQQKLRERMERATLWNAGDGLIWAAIPMGGHDLYVGFEEDRRNVQPALLGVVGSVGGAAIVLLTSILVTRRMTRPLVDVARSAESFRGSQAFESLPETGPHEVVTLAKSFNTMAREVSQLIHNRTTLLAGISHDLRTPIARMRLIVELLVDRVDESGLASLKRLEHNLEEMEALLSSALQFARGLSAEDIDTTRVDALLMAALQDVPEMPNVVWECDRDILVNVARQAFGRVLTNLLNNAERHGRRPIMIRLRRTRDRDSESDVWFEVHVEDSGNGIPEDVRDQVFQPFFRVEHSRSTDTGGSGLGLAIVRQLCEAQGWRIGVAAACSGGADVWFGVRAGRRLSTRHLTH